MKNHIDPIANAKDWNETEFKKLDTKVTINIILSFVQLILIICFFAFLLGAVNGLTN